MLVRWGGGGSSPWKQWCTPHGAYPKSTLGYGALFARLWGSVLLFHWWQLSAQRSCFPNGPLKGCCFHQQVGSTICMAVLSGRVCTKICFHRCFSGRYFLWAGLRHSSLSSQSNAGSGKEMGQRGIAAGSYPLYHLLPETVAHSHFSRRNPACLGELHACSISSVEVYPFLSVAVQMILEG